MFKKNNNNDGENSSAGNPSASATLEGNNISPPLRPFSKNGTHGSNKKKPGVFKAEIPRRVLVGASVSKQSEHLLSLNDEANRLTVGRNIRLNGEITACQKLVVDGRVEATLNDAHKIEISEDGHFKGKAEVMEAEISGRFEGTLVVKNLLTIHKSGRIDGSVRYGEIIIEVGGQISGDMGSLDETNHNTNIVDNDGSS
jgi:cytoskeletal protein CcmA (bactofilin family)